jgi:hypothetical protein
VEVRVATADGVERAALEQKRPRDAKRETAGGRLLAITQAAGRDV